MTTIDDTTINGDGTQNVFGNTVDRDLVFNQFNYVRERRAMRLPEGEIVERLAEYVPAFNHGQIVERLRLDHAVALCGRPGAGVAMTAIAALREVRPGLEIRRFTAGEDDAAEIGPSDAVGYLVRARDEEASRLRSCAEVMRASGGYLLVVGAENDYRPEWSDFLPPLRVLAPVADAVYRRRLACRGLGDTGWPDWPGAAELLKDSPPGEGRRLADIVRVVEREGGDEDDVVRAYRGWKDQLRHWFADHEEPRDRTLMIAAATISPADETSVYGAALSLARQLDVTVPGAGLAWCPSTGLSELIGTDADEGRVVFRRHGYAESVLHFVWRDYPLARTDLLTWLSALPVDDGVNLNTPLRRRVARVFAELAAEQGESGRILGTARAWADRDQADLAYVVLAGTCLHPVVGGRVRKGLYHWSRERGTPQTLKLTIVRVSQLLGVTYPSVALTRLKHLATFGNRQVCDEVEDAAFDLAQVHEGEVVQAALGWCESAARMSSGRDGARLAGVALNVLLRLANRPDASGPPVVGAVLRGVELLAARGGAFGVLGLGAAQNLAVRYRTVVVRTALVWADDAPTHPASRARLGAALFLTLAAEEGADGLAVLLTGPGALDPLICATAWYVALDAPNGGSGEDVAVRLWLETARARPDLRPGIVKCLTSAASGDPRRRRLMVELVREWAGDQRACRDVRDDILVRILQPEWERLLLALWVWLRRTVGAFSQQ
ncbi:hypothetical protein GCM10022254_45050 [Actinomadura meridiana]|uniref:Uncharacterized protein n=1 Tax=Actinomadura meridiana TaxID=559626 RepID=A0ABP8C9N2_9ACTN